MAKNRPLRAVYRRLGRVDTIIAEIIGKTGSADVLEVGCGLGLPMIELQRKFQSRLNITGINRDARFNQPYQAMKEGVRQLALMPWVPFVHEKQYGLPSYVNCDASVTLPFPDNSFDFIYSIATTFFFHDKLHFLSEMNRILRPGAVARIHFSYDLMEFANYKKMPPAPYNNLCEIRNTDGSIIDFPEFIDGFPEFRIVKQADGRDEYLELRKARPTVEFGVQHLEGYFLNEKNPAWDDFVKSVYAVVAPLPGELGQRVEVGDSA